MEKLKNKIKNGFTLVELLAVIVILAIILVIAVPKVMSVIEDAKKKGLESSAQMIASQAEKAKVRNAMLGKTESITCKDITNINDVDYASCEITFDDNIAKVTITGSGKFEGLYVCNGTKTESTATNESCAPVVNAVSFATDDWTTIVSAVKSGNYPYQVGETKTIDLGADLGEHTIRVANTTKCSDEWMEDATKSQTACGFVLEFEDIVHSMKLSSGSSNAGGWPSTFVRTYLNDEEDPASLYNLLPEELRKGIIKTNVVSSHGLNDKLGNLADGNYSTVDYLYLLSLMEVYGSNPDGYDSSATADITRQLDYYEKYEGTGYTGVSKTNYEGAIKKDGGTASWWWHRSAYSSIDERYCGSNSLGRWGSYEGYNNGGVAPAFRLAN